MASNRLTFRRPLERHPLSQDILLELASKKPTPPSTLATPKAPTFNSNSGSARKPGKSGSASPASLPPLHDRIGHHSPITEPSTGWFQNELSVETIRASLLHAASASNISVIAGDIGPFSAENANLELKENNSLLSAYLKNEIDDLRLSIYNALNKKPQETLSEEDKKLLATARETLGIFVYILYALDRMPPTNTLIERIKRNVGNLTASLYSLEIEAATAIEAPAAASNNVDIGRNATVEAIVGLAYHCTEPTDGILSYCRALGAACHIECFDRVDKKSGKTLGLFKDPFSIITDKKEVPSIGSCRNDLEKQESNELKNRSSEIGLTESELCKLKIEESVALNELKKIAPERLKNYLSLPEQTLFYPAEDKTPQKDKDPLKERYDILLKAVNEAVSDSNPWFRFPLHNYNMVTILETMRTAARGDTLINQKQYQILYETGKALEKSGDPMVALWFLRTLEIVAATMLFASIITLLAGHPFIANIAVNIITTIAAPAIVTPVAFFTSEKYLKKHSPEAKAIIDACNIIPKPGTLVRS